MKKGKKKNKSAVLKSVYAAAASTEAVIPIEPVSTNDEITKKMKDLVRSQYLNSKYSDLSIRCGDEVFPAHQNIIGPQSKYFEVACDSSFKESNGEIILEDRDPGLVKKALEFLYTGDYTYDGSSNAQAFFHAQMYAQGDYFQINGLKTRARHYFKECFLDHPSRDSFNSSVIEVYSSTGEYDRGLRDLVVKLTTDNLQTLRLGENSIFCDSILESVPSFMLDVCISALDKCATYQRQQCQSWDYQERNW